MKLLLFRIFREQYFQWKGSSFKQGAMVETVKNMSRETIQGLREKWASLAENFSSDREKIDELWNELEEAYSEEKRSYHNLNHLVYLFEKKDQISEDLEDAIIFDLAIFYHDFIHKVQRKDNERESAEVAFKRLKELGVPADRAEHCKRLIESTETNEPQTEPDSDYLNDIDLAILGEPPEKYDEYVDQIRKEYSLYPDFLFNPGRKNVLNHFLETDQLYQTDYFHKHYEKQARENISKELKTLDF